MEGIDREAPSAEVDVPKRRRFISLATLPAIAAVGIALALIVYNPGLRTASSAPHEPDDEDAFKLVLMKAVAALPHPGKSFRLDPESTANDLHEGLPLGARAVRVFEKPARPNEDDAVSIEVRVYLNRERFLPEPLGSEAGPPVLLTQDGAPGVRFGLAGVDVGRVALPVDPTEAANSLTVARLFVGTASARSYLDQIAHGLMPDRTPWDKAGVGRPTDVRTIVVEYYGPRAEVDRLLKATAIAPLRALLTPKP